ATVMTCRRSVIGCGIAAAAAVHAADAIPQRTTCDRINHQDTKTPDFLGFSWCLGVLAVQVRATVARAIISSSSVAMTRTVTRLVSREITGTPAALSSGSISSPR